MNNNSIIKKTIILLFAGIYLFFSSGLIVNKLYCTGELTQIGFLNNNEKCNKCPIEKNCNQSCCDNEIVFLKLIDSPKLNSSAKNVLAQQITLFDFIAQYHLNKCENNSKINYVAFTLPFLINHEPVFLVNRSILI